MLGQRRLTVMLRATPTCPAGSFGRTVTRYAPAFRAMPFQRPPHATWRLPAASVSVWAPRSAAYLVPAFLATGLARYSVST